jgi:hypothetical protein
MSRAFGPQHAFLVQIAVVLDDPAVSGVIVFRVIQERGSGEDVAFLERLQRGFVGHFLFSG